MLPHRTSSVWAPYLALRPPSRLPLLFQHFQCAYLTEGRLACLSILLLGAGSKNVRYMHGDGCAVTDKKEKNFGIKHEAEEVIFKTWMAPKRPF
mmetsp:Transcript_29686/g.76678  ORF Transcript_29686/g.76678 Transcript_29686/m.76678 type:complete len:94 (+) Transcript_29686:429-710(+)